MFFYVSPPPPPMANWSSNTSTLKAFNELMSYLKYMHTDSTTRTGLTLCTMSGFKVYILSCSGAVAIKLGKEFLAVDPTTKSLGVSNVRKFHLTGFPIGTNRLSDCFNRFSDRPNRLSDAASAYLARYIGQRPDTPERLAQWRWV